jgi:hypothetical protein
VRPRLRRVTVRLLSWTTALLLAAGLATAQIMLGGWWYPALAAPGLLLVAAAAVSAGLLFFRATDAPGAWCAASTLAWAGFLFWRQASSPDPYAAAADTWLLLGALCVYFTVGWQVRGDTARWLVLVPLFALATGQVFLAVMQFAADAPFHPLADWARHLALPAGGENLPNHGYVSGTLANRTALSGVLEITTFLALGLLVWGRAGAAGKLLLLWVVAAGFAGLTLCLSRSAYLAVPTGVGVFALASFFVINRGVAGPRLWPGSAALALVALSLGLALTLGLESTAVQMRAAALPIDEYRERLWFLSVPPMLSLDPWWGTGANSFDDLSVRYRGTGFTARPIHAHNDWLQLLVEYGRAGFLLGVLFFLVHFAAGWRNALRLAREAAPTGWMPQGTDLGLATGALAAWAAVGAHAVFDYSLHVPAVAMLAALCGGWLASARRDPSWPPPPLPWWLRILGLLPLVFGLVLMRDVARELPAERLGLTAENARVEGDAAAAWEAAREGLARRPGHVRLLTVAGESAVLLGNAAAAPEQSAEWYARAADDFTAAAAVRPLSAYLRQQQALALDWSGGPGSSVPVHLRAIARDPDHARGYEYFALHYWRRGRPEEAARLMRLAQRLPGASLAGEFLPRIEEDRQAARP